MSTVDITSEMVTRGREFTDVPHAQKRAMEKMYDTKLKIYTHIYMWKGFEKKTHNCSEICSDDAYMLDIFNFSMLFFSVKKRD